MSRWLREYVPTLNKHVNWHTSSEGGLKSDNFVRITGGFSHVIITKLSNDNDHLARAVVRSSADKYTPLTAKLAPVLAPLGVEDVSACYNVFIYYNLCIRRQKFGPVFTKSLTQNWEKTLTLKLKVWIDLSLVRFFQTIFAADFVEIIMCWASFCLVFSMVYQFQNADHIKPMKYYDDKSPTLVEVVKKVDCRKVSY